MTPFRPPWILWRHVLVEVARCAALGLAVATLVLVLGSLLQNLVRMLDLGIGLHPILRITLIALPSFMSYALPAALLFGVVVAFGTLAEDGEIVAMQAGGIGVAQLLPPVLLLGALATALATYIVLELEPLAKNQWRALYREMIAQDEIIRPGQVRPAGGQTLYVAQRGEGRCPLRGVIVADLADPLRPVYIHATCGVILEGKGDELRPRVELADGSIHFGGAQADSYRKIEFARLSLTFDLSLLNAPQRRLASIGLSELREVDRRLARGEDSGLRRAPTRAQVQSEIQRRIAFPLASLALAFLGVPLGIRARAGRSGGMFAAVVLLGAYQCLVAVGFALGDGGHVLPLVGIWFANAFAVLCGGWLLGRDAR